MVLNNFCYLTEFLQNLFMWQALQKCLILAGCETVLQCVDIDGKSDRQQERKTNRESAPAMEDTKKQKNRGRMSCPNQSCQLLLPFHPDNAPPSKVKTSPLMNPALPARLISTDYPFKCHYPLTLIQPKIKRWRLHQKPHNNTHSHQ